MGKEGDKSPLRREEDDFPQRSAEDDLPPSTSGGGNRSGVRIGLLASGFVAVLIVGIAIGSLAFGSTTKTECPAKEPDPYIPYQRGTFPPSDDEYKCDGHTIHPRFGVCGEFGVVSSDHDIATEAGARVLRMGGNAREAAVAVQLALGVVTPENTGIGGGCFAVIYNSETGEVSALDGREEAPEAFLPNTFCSNQTCAEDPGCECPEGALTYWLRNTGGHSAGVPGVPAAIRELMSQGTGLTLEQLAAPAVEAAEGGFPMTHHLANSVRRHRDRLKYFEGTRDLFLRRIPGPNCTLEEGMEVWTLEGHCFDVAKEPGEMFRNPDLAQTMRELADRGIEDFYSGEIMKDTVAAARSARYPRTNRTGLVTEEDYRMYKAVYREPTRVNYRKDYTVFGMPLPSSGGLTMGQQANILENFRVDQTREGQAPVFTETFLHRMVDTMNYGFSDRHVWLGDPDFESFAKVPSGYLDKEYAAKRVGEHSHPTMAAGRPYGKVPHGYPPGSDPELKPASHGEAPHHGTSHFTIIDKDKNIVTLTTTIEVGLGCGVVVNGRGFLLNNELTDFDPLGLVNGTFTQNSPMGGKKPRKTALPPHTGTLGGKRPMSSMSPTIVFKGGRPIFAWGSPGGWTIVQTVFSMLPLLTDFELPIQEAVGCPRLVANNVLLYLEAPMAEHRFRGEVAYSPEFLEKCGFPKGSGMLANVSVEDSLCLRGFRLTHESVWHGERPLGRLHVGSIDWNANPPRIFAAPDHQRLERGTALGVDEAPVKRRA